MRSYSVLHDSLQPAVERLAVHFLHIDQQDTPADRVADELHPARVLATAVPAVVVLFLREAANRLAAELLEGAADVTHVEEELLVGGDLRWCANTNPHRTIA